MSDIMPPFNVGDLVRLGVPWLDNPAGTIGICYETFKDKENDPGVSLLFPNCQLDSFSPRGVVRFQLAIVGHVPALAQYQFTDERQVKRDFAAGVFAAAWAAQDKGELS